MDNASSYYVQCLVILCIMPRHVSCRIMCKCFISTQSWRRRPYCGKKAPPISSILLFVHTVDRSIVLYDSTLTLTRPRRPSGWYPPRRDCCLLPPFAEPRSWCLGLCGPPPSEGGLPTAQECSHHGIEKTDTHRADQIRSDVDHIRSHKIPIMIYL